RRAVRTSGSPTGSSVTTAISYGPDCNASATAPASPVGRAWLATIGAGADNAAAPASRQEVTPLRAAYVTSAAHSADCPDGMALSVGSAGRVTSGSASSGVSKKPP